MEINLRSTIDCGWPRGSDEANTLSVGGDFNRSLAGDSIRWVENGRTRNGAEESKIFESHLRGAVFSDGNTSVGADKVGVSLGDSSHSDLIRSAGEEGRESRGKGNSSVSTSSTDSDTSKKLLGDEALAKSFGVFLHEIDGEGRVLCVSVKSDDPIAGVAELGQSGSVSLSSGNLVSLLVARWGGELDISGEGSVFNSGDWSSRGDFGISVFHESFDVFLDFVAEVLAHGLAMPVVTILLLGHVFTLESLGNDKSGFSFSNLGFMEGLVDGVHIVTIDHDCVHSPGFTSRS